MMYHFRLASSPPPEMREGSRTPVVPFVGLRMGEPLLRALKARGLLDVDWSVK
jgi:hypothetical protein